MLSPNQLLAARSGCEVRAFVKKALPRLKVTQNKGGRLSSRVRATVFEIATDDG